MGELKSRMRIEELAVVDTAIAAAVAAAICAASVWHSCSSTSFEVVASAEELRRVLSRVRAR